MRSQSLVSDKQNFSFLPSCISDPWVTRQKSHFRCRGLPDRYYCDFSGGNSSWQKNASSDKPFHLVFWCWETEPRNCWEIQLIHEATVSPCYFGFLYLTRICWNNILDLLAAHLWSLTRSCKWPLFFTALFAYLKVTVEHFYYRFTF
jgi:hypothetical protein